jgi:hypothetical protein
MQQLEFYTTLKDRSLLREGNIMYNTFYARPMSIYAKTYVKTQWSSSYDLGHELRGIRKNIILLVSCLGF